MGPADPAVEGDEIRLAVPASPEHGRVARVMVGRLAVRHGLRARAVEDLRIATDESVIVLLGEPSGGPGTDPDLATLPGSAAEPDGTLTVRARLEPDRLAVDLWAPDAGEPSPDALERFRRLVVDLVDEVEVDSAARRVRFSRRRDRT